MGNLFTSPVEKLSSGRMRGYEDSEGLSPLQQLGIAVLTSAIEDMRGPDTKRQASYSGGVRRYVEVPNLDKHLARDFLLGTDKANRTMREFYCEMAGVSPEWVQRKVSEAGVKV